jgi:hypothetical protein
MGSSACVAEPFARPHLDSHILAEGGADCEAEVGGFAPFAVLDSLDVGLISADPSGLAVARMEFLSGLLGRGVTSLDLDDLGGDLGGPSCGALRAFAFAFR